MVVVVVEKVVASSSTHNTHHHQHKNTTHLDITSMKSYLHHKFGFEIKKSKTVAHRSREREREREKWHQMEKINNKQILCLFL